MFLQIKDPINFEGVDNLPPSKKKPMLHEMSIAD